MFFFNRIMAKPMIRPHAIMGRVRAAQQTRLQTHQFQARRTNVRSAFDWKPVKSSDNKPKFTISRTIFLTLLVAMPLVTFYLGTWQLRRLQWKNNLIATSEDRLTYDPIPLPKHINPEDVEDLQYRRFIVKGRYDHSREVFVGPKVKFGEPGYTVFTPFIRSDGGETILIERGFLMDDKILPPRRTLKHLSLPMHEVEVEIILKATQRERSKLIYDKLDPDSRVWHIVNVDEMTEFTGCAPFHAQALIDLKDHPVVSKTIKEPKPWWKFWRSAKTHEELELVKVAPEDVQEFGQLQLMKAGVPVGRPAAIDFRNNHLQYLVTWYGLCIASSILLFILLKKTPRVDSTKAKLEHARKFQ